MGTVPSVIILRSCADFLYYLYLTMCQTTCDLFDKRKTFTGSDWTDTRNYDMTLNVRRFGVNGAVDFILQSIE